MNSGHYSARALTRIGLAVVAAVGAALVIKGLYPADLPGSRNPDFVDNIFDNRGVLWATRLLLVSAAGVLAFGGIFILLSISARMKNKEWLRRAGPFEISEGMLRQVEDEVDFWRRSVLASRQEADDLRLHLRQAEEMLRDMGKATSNAFVCAKLGLESMTREELNKKIDRTVAESRAAIEKADAFFRWLDREVPIREATTERAIRELRESIRRR